MADPQPPPVPDSASQELKDFVSCKRKTATLGGDLGWLLEGAKATVKQGATATSATITVDIPHVPNVTLPASITNGELVIDTSPLPLGGDFVKGWVKQLNEWFKFNKVCLGAPLFGGDKVTLVKQPCPPPAAATPPKAVPPAMLPPATATPKAAPPSESSNSGSSGGCLKSLGLGLLVLTVLLLGAIAFAPVGLLPGAPVAEATTTPSPTAGPTPSPSPSPSSSPTPSPSASATPTAGASPTPSATIVPPTTTAAQVAVDRACIKVTHQALQQFVSYLDMAIWLTGGNFNELLILMNGVNDDAPYEMHYDVTSGTWEGQLGLHQAGPKAIVKATAVLADGSSVDVTDMLVAALGGSPLNVRYPEEDTFGSCD